MLHLMMVNPGAWAIPVVSVSSIDETGFDVLAGKIAAHRAYLDARPESDRRAARVRWEITKRAIARIAFAARNTDAWNGHATRDAQTRALLEKALD